MSADWDASGNFIGTGVYEAGTPEFEAAFQKLPRGSRAEADGLAAESGADGGDEEPQQGGWFGRPSGGLGGWGR